MPYCQFKKEKVSAILYENSVNGYRHELYVTGNIPKEYKSGDSIKVRACLEDIHEGDGILYINNECDNGGIVYKLKCIEKEEETMRKKYFSYKIFSSCEK